MQVGDGSEDGLLDARLGQVVGDDDQGTRTHRQAPPAEWTRVHSRKAGTFQSLSRKPLAPVLGGEGLGVRGAGIQGFALPSPPAPLPLSTGGEGRRRERILAACPRDRTGLQCEPSRGRDGFLGGSAMKTIRVGVITQAEGAHLGDYFGSLASCPEVEAVALADPSGKHQESAAQDPGEEAG